MPIGYEIPFFSQFQRMIFRIYSALCVAYIIWWDWFFRFRWNYFFFIWKLWNWNAKLEMVCRAWEYYNSHYSFDIWRCIKVIWNGSLKCSNDLYVIRGLFLFLFFSECFSFLFRYSIVSETSSHYSSITKIIVEKTNFN